MGAGWRSACSSSASCSVLPTLTGGRMKPTQQGMCWRGRAQLQQWHKGTALTHYTQTNHLLCCLRSYTDTEGARDYSTQITSELLLLSPSLQSLQKPSRSGNAPHRAPFSMYMCKAPVHPGEASLTEKSQTAINTFLHGAAYAAWHLWALFRWLGRVWAFITVNLLTSGTRHHCTALKEPEMGKAGQERTRDLQDEVTPRGRGEEVELQQKMLQVRDRDKGWERKHLFIQT